MIGIDLRTRKLLFDPIEPGDAGWEFESSPVATDAHFFVSLRWPRSLQRSGARGLPRQRHGASGVAAATCSAGRR